MYVDLFFFRFLMYEYIALPRNTVLVKVGIWIQILLFKVFLHFVL